ncbi:hypothetical protein PanWU01x14_134980 [Parasponia andersonii]|uniref:Uncharacterized protein n=1 Tax=Parasponia andersonii TaxID=3476 RepID=A0A2P5CP73_PARAD|nr:hypothetical protein PanWU01x14_134980 [Parasponia andersonii]
MSILAPYNRMPRWLQVQTFYNGLDYMSKSVVDRVAGGSLYSKTADEVYEMIKAMAYYYQFQSQYSMPTRAIGAYEADVILALSPHAATLSR